ncbi:glycerate kinase [Kribbella solani]|uniref:glycerate kinase n=1 Tax=Kribbella solani TaxID=236067 RepID=UPI0029B02E10|nr:glycerate kinase [Kribbella solani]MDX2974142.1 glycerate kinase [Kribbella solani]MDX3001585.1 glycerate kinase [Kribbella solani]
MGSSSAGGFRVVIAADKFKGSLPSSGVAAALTTGILRVAPHATVVTVPVADGGDGTLSAALAAGYTSVPHTAQGPTGHPRQTIYARSGATAVVELAAVSGLVHLPGDVPAPLTATTYGTGQLLAAALDAGCTRIILGIGGSASTDGGAGLIHALTGTQTLDLEVLRRRLRGVEVVVACDVDNPLTGPNGAGAVYGPQKGASPEQVRELDERLTEWADVVADATGRDLRDVPGAGAAGGVGFAALALLNAELRPGIELVLEMVGFYEKLIGADLVITGEGALDEQTLHGKAVAGVAAAAGDSSATGRSAGGVPVVSVCGVNRLDDPQLQEIGVRAAYALTDLEPDVQRCIADPEPLLEQLGERIAVEHLTMARTEGGIG